VAFYLRKDKLTTFDGGTTVDDAWRAQAKGAFTLRPGEESLSVFEAEDDHACDLVAAALALANQQERPVDILKISREELERFGTVERDGQGDTPIAAVNACHASLHTTQEQLTALAEHLRQQGRKVERRKWREHVLPVLLKTDPASLVGGAAPAAAVWLEALKAKRPR